MKASKKVKQCTRVQLFLQRDGLAFCADVLSPLLSLPRKCAVFFFLPFFSSLPDLAHRTALQYDPPRSCTGSCRPGVVALSKAVMRKFPMFGTDGTRPTLLSLFLCGGQAATTAARSVEAAPSASTPKVRPSFFPFFSPAFVAQAAHGTATTRSETLWP